MPTTEMAFLLMVEAYYQHLLFTKEIIDSPLKRRGFIVLIGECPELVSLGLDLHVMQYTLR